MDGPFPLVDANEEVERVVPMLASGSPAVLVQRDGRSSASSPAPTCSSTSPTTAGLSRLGVSHMAIQSQPLTYDDLERMGETRDERLELIEGELVVTPSPTTIHQRVIRRLHHLLEKAIIEAGVGEFFPAPYDVKLADGSIVQPDLVAVLTDRFARHCG